MKLKEAMNLANKIGKNRCTVWSEAQSNLDNNNFAVICPPIVLFNRTNLEKDFDAYPLHSIFAFCDSIEIVNICEKGVSNKSLPYKLSKSQLKSLMYIQNKELKSMNVVYRKYLKFKKANHNGKLLTSYELNNLKTFLNRLQDIGGKFRYEITGNN